MDFADVLNSLQILYVKFFLEKLEFRKIEFLQTFIFLLHDFQSIINLLEKIP